MRRPLVLAVALTLNAQEPRFGAQSRLVLVPVTVTDGKGRSVDGLASNDFLVLDNGRPQKTSLDTIGTGVAPVALIVAVQASGISEPVLEKVRKIGAMIQPLITGERGCAGVVSFSQRIDWLQECTQDPTAVARAFKRIRPGGEKSGRMLDAVYESVERLRAEPNARHVLLLISESRDRGSTRSLEEVTTAIQSAGVTVYSATYSAMATAFTTNPRVDPEPQTVSTPVPPSPPPCASPACAATSTGGAAQSIDFIAGIVELARLGKTNTTQALAIGSGGTCFRFTRLKGLQDAIEKLGAELHSQYVLSFVPEDATNGYHRLEVRVIGSEYQVRARPGYWPVH